MALPVQNINHSAFRLMFKRENIFGNNFNDWFRQLKLALRVKKKMYVIEQHISPALAVDSVANVLAEWNVVYDAYNEVDCLCLGGKPVAAYVLKMKRYVEQLERLGYVLPQDLSGLPKKAETPQVMAIRGGKIKKNNKKSLKAKDKAKDGTCHHCKEVGHWKMNCLVYLAELLKKKKPVGTASSSVSKNNVLYFNVIPSNGIYEIDMHNLVLNVNSIYNVSNKRAKHNLDSTYLWHCRLAHISKKRIKKLQQEGILKSTDDGSFDQCISCLSGKMTRK
ncbi:zinc finger, CCHC-type containing protein, partial [Tanacetum coccineum]